MKRFISRLVIAMSLLLCAITAIGWRRSVGRGDHSFDLVRWDGSEGGYFDRGLACRARYGLLEVSWIRIRGGFAPDGVVDECGPLAVASSAEYPEIPGVGDSRATRAGPAGRWNWSDHVWDFDVREDELLDTRPPLIDTGWGLRIAVQKAAWEAPYRGGVYWRRMTVRHLRAPFWLVVSLFAFWPFIWLASRVRRGVTRRGRPGTQCLACGYDLRATPDRCPECGKIPAGR